MKRTLFITLLSFISIVSFGQKIHFSDSTNRWHCFQLGLALLPPIIDSVNFTYNGTILLHDTLYEQLAENGGCIGYIREDTVAKKVFGIYFLPIGTITHSSIIDSTEYVLYDYNLQIGDTFKRPYTVNHYVDNVDSVLINGISYKTWHLVPTTIDSDIGQGVQNDYYVIEGIGSLNYPFFPADPTTFEVGWALTCFSTEGDIPPLSQMVGSYFDNSTSCSLTFGLGVNNITNKAKNAIIMPNPINENSKIALPHTITTGTLIVVNDIGQEILSIPFQNKEEVLIGDKIKAPGIYYYRVTDNINGQTFSGEFVSE